MKVRRGLVDRANVIGIDTERGYRLIELFHGDLLEGVVSADVLVVSAYAGSYVPTPGTLVESLHRWCGVDLDAESRHPAFDLRTAFGCWVTYELTALRHFERVLVVEMRWGRSSPVEAINNVFVTLAALEAKGVPVQSLAMPVLGAGAQGLAPDDIMPVMVRESERALHRQEHLERISFVERDEMRAQALSVAMDVTLGRAGVTLPKTELIASLKKDLANAVSHVAAHVPRGNAALVRELHRLASETTRSSHEVGLIARRLVEFVVDDLLARPKTSPDLARKIDALGALGVSPWIRGYMHTLRLLGNEAVHERGSDGRFPPHVGQEDLAIALFCTLRIVVFWKAFVAEQQKNSSTSDVSGA